MHDHYMVIETLRAIEEIWENLVRGSKVSPGVPS